MERELQRNQAHGKRRDGVSDYEGAKGDDKKHQDEKQQQKLSQLTSNMMLQTIKPNLLHYTGRGDEDIPIDAFNWRCYLQEVAYLALGGSL